MKTKLPILFAFALVAFAQSQITIEDSKPSQWAYSHDGLYTTRLYTNGVPCRDYTRAQLDGVIADGTNTLHIFTVPGFSRNVTLTVSVISDDGVESDQGEPLSVQVKPRKPGNLRRFQ